jgi:fructokinase
MILSCGEALIDFIPSETKDGAPAWEAKTGGSVMNTAIAIGRLGVRSAFFGGLSSDINLSPVMDRYTILAFVKLEGGQARYSFIDEGSACRMLSTGDLKLLPDSVAAIHLGSFPIAIEPCGAAFEALCVREHQRRVINFDPNIRANLIKDKAAHRARVERIVAMADIVKLSEEDLDWLSPGASHDEFAKDWLRRGARLVIVTRGKDGAEGFTRDFRCDVPGREVRVADTIGAGDTFTAAILCALQRAGKLSKAAIASLDRDSVSAAIGFAIKAAAVTVSRPGADPPWAHELEG